MYDHEELLGVWSGIAGDVAPHNCPKSFQRDGEFTCDVVTTGNNWYSFPLSSLELTVVMDDTEYLRDIGDIALSDVDMENLEKALSSENCELLREFFPDSTDAE